MKNIYVKDQYRKNPLSLEPGGYEVTIVYKSGERKIYDKVKSPKLFIAKIENNKRELGRILEILVDGESSGTYLF
jgi:hypothetical protein